GVAFFVKYSFEHNLIPPELRVAIGFVIGISLLIGGLLLKRKENAVTAQTLCATGVLVLYAVTFACRSYYHFGFFGFIPTFLLMTLITAVGFLLAVRLNAVVVAVLGIAGGFLTPVLLSTGQDHPLGLFMYIALLDVGLLAVSQRQRWNVLPTLSAVGTALMQFAWVAAFFVPEKYFAGNKVLVAMAVFAGFEALFLAAVAWSKRTAKLTRELFACALGLAAVAMFSAFYLLSFQTIAQRPALLFSYLFVIDLGLLVLTLIDSRHAIVEALAGLMAFIFLAAWTENYLTTRDLYTALAFYFVFTLLHAAAPIALQHLRKIEIPWWSHAFPALALLLVLIPIFQLSQLSILVWPFVLIVDLLAIVLALATATLLPILAVLVLIMVTLRLPLANPSPVFGLALLLVILLLGVSEIFSLDLLPAVALVSVLALEHAWHFEHFDPTHASVPMVWYLGFYALFTIFPFIFHRKFAGKTAPWAAAALAGPLHFYLVYDLIRSAYPSVVPGLVPAAFGLPSLLGLSLLRKRTPATSRAR